MAVFSGVKSYTPSPTSLRFSQIVFMWKDKAQACLGVISAWLMFMYSTETSIYPERNYYFLCVKIWHFGFLLSLWSPVDIISIFLHSSSSLFPLVMKYTHPHHWLLSSILKIYCIKTIEWDSFTMTKTELTFLKRHILTIFAPLKGSQSQELSISSLSHRISFME